MKHGVNILELAPPREAEVGTVTPFVLPRVGLGRSGWCMPQVSLGALRSVLMEAGGCRIKLIFLVAAEPTEQDSVR